MKQFEDVCGAHKKAESFPWFLTGNCSVCKLMKGLEGNATSHNYLCRCVNVILVKISHCLRMANFMKMSGFYHGAHQAICRGSKCAKIMFVNVHVFLKTFKTFLLMMQIF